MPAPAAKRPQGIRNYESSEQDYSYVSRTNPFAITSLVLGLMGASVLAIIFGHLAKKQLETSHDSGEGLATAGLVLGYLGLITTIIIIFIYVQAINSISSMYYY